MPDIQADQEASSFQKSEQRRILLVHAWCSVGRWSRVFRSLLASALTFSIGWKVVGSRPA